MCRKPTPRAYRASQRVAKSCSNSLTDRPPAKAELFMTSWIARLGSLISGRCCDQRSRNGTLVCIFLSDKGVAADLAMVSDPGPLLNFNEGPNLCLVADLARSEERRVGKECRS